MLLMSEAMDICADTNQTRVTSSGGGSTSARMFRRTHAPATTRAPRDFARMSDRVLLEHVIEGSERGWVTFFRRFRALIVSCAVKTGLKCGVRLAADDLDDLLSEVAMNMIANNRRRLRLYRADGGSSIATWVGLIAVSTTRDYLRRMRRDRLEPIVEQELERVACENPGPEEILIDRQARASVDRLLSGLSARDRRFVELYFGAAMDPELIAEEMGISVATVYSKKAKIKTRLTELIAAQHEEDDMRLAV